MKDESIWNSIWNIFFNIIFIWNTFSGKHLYLYLKKTFETIFFFFQDKNDFPSMKCDFFLDFWIILFVFLLWKLKLLIFCQDFFQKQRKTAFPIKKKTLVPQFWEWKKIIFKRYFLSVKIFSSLFEIKSIISILFEILFWRLFSSLFEIFFFDYLAQVWVFNQQKTNYLTPTKSCRP